MRATCSELYAASGVRARSRWYAASVIVAPHAVFIV
jgi:hypothetical protein